MKYSVPYLLALLTGGMMSLGFPPYKMAWLSWVPWVAFAPVVVALLFLPMPRKPVKRVLYAFSLGFLAALTFFLLTLSWLMTVAWEGAVLLPCGLACYGGFWSLFVMIFVRPREDKNEPESSLARSGLGWLSSSRNLYVALCVAASWAALEWLRGTLFSGFGWNSFGVAFRHNLPVLQVSDITGVGGLSFLGVFTGTILAITIKRFSLEIPLRKKINPLVSFGRPHGDLVVTLLLVTIVMGYGMHELLLPIKPQEELSLAAIQANVSQGHKWDPAFEAAIMKTYERLTTMALAVHPDLVVWPEAATPRPLLQDEIIFAQVKALAKKGKTDFLIGSLDYENNPPRDYNAAILLTQQASQIQLYAKTHLVPFGEYIPFRKEFPPFTWIIGDRILGDFNAGPGPKLLTLSTKPVKVAPLLCFEDTLGDLVRRFADLGAQLLITLTNDGWFGHSAQSEQHMANAQLRSAETKIPLLRVANTGVTCLIDSWGRVVATLHASDGSTFMEGIFSTKCKVPLHPEKTFYTRHGDLFSHGCLVLTVLVLFIGVGKSISNRRKNIF